MLPFPQITLVGKVLTTNESGLTYGLEIDDGTGKAAVKIWISDDGGWVGLDCRAVMMLWVAVKGLVGGLSKQQAGLNAWHG